MIMAKLTSARNIFQSSQSLPINYLFQFHCTWYFNWLGNNMQTVNNILIFSMELKSVLLCSSSVLQESFVWMKKYLKLQFFGVFFHIIILFYLFIYSLSVPMNIYHHSQKWLLQHILIHVFKFIILIRKSIATKELANN